MTLPWTDARDPAWRRRHGQWVTPEWIVDAVTARACRGLGPGAVIVDPACGDGRFLQAAAREVPGARLIGFDIDPIAIAEARKRLPDADLRLADALASPLPPADLVLGNPPWVRPQNLPREVREDLWARFETATDKCDLFTCFVEHGIAASRRLAFVLPDAWLGLASFAAMRARLAGAGVDGVFRLPPKAFPGIVPRSVAVFVDPADGRLVGDLGPDGVEITGRLAIGPEAWSLDGPLPDLPGKPLGEHLALAMGVVCGDYDRYVHQGRQLAEDRRTCRGRDVRRWEIAPTDEHVWYVPDDMLARKPYVAPKSASTFDVPEKLVIAGASGTVIRAAMDVDRRFPLDSCYVGLARPGVDAWAMLGFLLSRPVGDWYAARHRAVRVKAVELARVPIPGRGWDAVAAAARARDEAALDRAVDAAYALAREARV